MGQRFAVSLTQSMKKRGIMLCRKCSIADMQNLQADVLLSAVCRIPNLNGTELLNLKLGEHNGSVVDENGQTSFKGVYAAGDVVDGSMRLAHAAMEQGKRFEQYIAGEKQQKKAVVVNCIYTNPEIASVGISEIQAWDMDVVSAKYNMIANASTLIATDKRSFNKLLADRKTQKIIGAQFMCGRASDIAAELALAINNGLTVSELRESTRAHPSFCEAITEAAEVLLDKFQDNKT